MDGPEATNPHRLGLRRIGLLGAIFVAIFVCYAATTARERVVNDVLSASLGSWRISTTGQPWFDGFALDEIPRAPHQRLWTGTATNGHVAVFRSPGAIAVGVPAYFLAGGDAEPDSFSITPGAMTAAFLSTISMLFFWLSIRRHLGDRTAIVSVLVLAFTTPMWTVNANSLWTHSLTVLGIAGLAWSAHRERWWMAGVFGGIALWGRLHAAVIVAILGLVLAIWRRSPRIAVVTGAVAACFMALCTVWSHWMYGTWNPSGSYPTVGQYTDHVVAASLLDQVVNEAGLWIAPDRGLLVWTPVLLLLLPAVVRAWTDLPDWTRALAVSGLVYTAIQGLMNGFTGGSSFFGYRLTLECLACLFPAYALSTHRMARTARTLLGPVLGLQFGAMALGATSEGFFLPSSEAWTDNSMWLALRTFPALWLWVSLMIVVGSLAGVVWRQRGWGTSAPSSTRNEIDKVL